MMMPISAWVLWLSIGILKNGSATRVEESPPPSLPPKRLKDPPPGLPPIPPAGSDNQRPLPEDIFSLDDTSSGGAEWRHELIAPPSKPYPSLHIEYKGARKGWDASSHDFDAFVPTSKHDGFSVVFRRTKVNSVGFGTHFYQKFAILPLGETDKSKSLYTVKMDTPHFSTGAKIWNVYKGYCKQRVGGLINICNDKTASGLPVRHIFCSIGYGAEKWAAGSPYSCRWYLGSQDSNIPGHAILEAEFFGGYLDDGSKSAKVSRANPEFWSNAELQQIYAASKADDADDDDDDDKPPQLQDPKGASAAETEFFLVIATALKQAFSQGGSGN